LGLRVEGLGFRVQASSFGDRGWKMRSRVKVLGVRGPGSGVWLQVSGFRVSETSRRCLSSFANNPHISEHTSTPRAQSTCGLYPWRTGNNPRSQTPSTNPETQTPSLEPQRTQPKARNLHHKPSTPNPKPQTPHSSNPKP